MSEDDPVYSFGENKTDQWYAHKDGVHVKCDESFINLLWWQYIINMTAQRNDNDEYTVFTVKEPGMSLKYEPPKIKEYGQAEV